jgi:hypothetical protein
LAGNSPKCRLGVRVLQRLSKMIRTLTTGEYLRQRFFLLASDFGKISNSHRHDCDLYFFFFFQWKTERRNVAARCFNTRETVNKPSTGSSKQSNCTSRPKWLKQEETDPSRNPLMESVIFPLYSFLSFFVCCRGTADLCACRSPSHFTQLCRSFFYLFSLLPC